MICAAWPVTAWRKKSRNKLEPTALVHEASGCVWFLKVTINMDDHAGCKPICCSHRPLNFYAGI